MQPPRSQGSSVAPALAACVLGLLLLFAIIGVFGMTAAILTTIGTALSSTVVWLRPTKPGTIK